MDTIQVLEGAEAEAAIKTLKTVVDLSPAEEGAPQVALLKQADCVVAPVVHGGTLTQDIVQKIFEAVKTTGSSSMVAIGLYSPEELHCYWVPMALEGLSELRGTSCGVVNFILYGERPGSEKPDWLVVFDNQLYIAYGPEPFVSALVGDVGAAYGSLEGTLAGLEEEAKGEIPGYIAQEIARMKEYLTSALRRLRQDYAQATPGERVTVV